jgi:predicted DNA-binding transcriptional regulator AlpA
MDTPKNMPETRRLLRIREVLQLCALSRATLYSKIKQHTFPAPVKLSARAVGWLHDDVMQWIDARIAQRGPAYHANGQTSSSEASVGTKTKRGRSQTQNNSK